MASARGVEPEIYPIADHALPASAEIDAGAEKNDLDLVFARRRITGRQHEDRSVTSPVAMRALEPFRQVRLEDGKIGVVEPVQRRKHRLGRRRKLLQLGHIRRSGDRG